MPPRGPGRLLLPVRCARLGDPREGQQPRPRPLDVRQRRQPRRRLRQRPAAVLGGGRRHRGRAALPRVDRQPAQVLPDRPPGLAAQADHRGPLGPHHPGRADGPRGPPDRGAAAGRRRDVPPGRRDPGRHPRGDVRRRPAARPPAAAARAAGSPSSATPTRSACWPPTPPPRSGWSSTSRSRSAPRPPPRTSRTPSTPRSTTPRSTPSSRSTSRRSTSPARTSPTCWPPWASSPTSRWSPRSSAPRASPSCSGCPTSPGSTAGRGSVPSYPAVEAAVRALARVVEYAVWLRTPDGAAGRRRRRRPGRARSGWSARCSREHPDGRRARPGRSSTALLGGVRHRAVGRPARSPTSEEAQAAGRGARLGRRAQGDRRATCASGPTWPTSGATSTPRRRCGDAWESLNALITEPDEGRLRRPEERPARGAGRDPQHRGPAVRAGRLVRHLRAAHRAARGPGLPDPAARRARRRGDGARDQVLADAVRLPRRRGRSTSPRSSG